MPHPNKKQRPGGADDDGKEQDDANFSSLSTDILANIYCYLPLKEIKFEAVIAEDFVDQGKCIDLPFQ
jgi:hypothetical protein